MNKIDMHRTQIIGLIKFPIIEIDNFYAEQLITTISDLKEIKEYVQFLIDNRFDGEMNWFSGLVSKLNAIEVNVNSEEYHSQVVKFINENMTRPETNYQFAIRNKINHKIIGFIHFNKQLGFDCCENLELYLHRDFRNLKIMSETLCILMRYFKENEIEKVTASVDIKNENSLHFLKKTAFTKMEN